MSSEFETLFQDQAMPALRDTFGSPYTYRRGTATVDITAEMVPHEEEETNDRGFHTSWRGVKFTTRGARLVLDEALITPTKGDEILQYLESGSAIVYTVLPPKDKPPYERIDGEGYEYLIYAKQTGTE
jgi:hypothetical protein